MILTGRAIAKQVAAGRIIIDPFDWSKLNPNSYNYRLSRTLKVIDDPVIDPHVEVQGREVEIGDGGMILEPGRLYLGLTQETLGSDDYVTSLIGRSSMGRLGVFLQVSADLGNLGAIHRWTLEIVVSQPIRLYSGMTIGQVTFWKPTGRILPYDGYLGSRFTATESRPEGFDFEPRPASADAERLAR